MNRQPFRAPRPAAQLALLALLAAPALAGCGSSRSPSTAQRPTASSTSAPATASTACPPNTRVCVTQSTSIKAEGSPLIDVNLERLIALNQPQLQHPVVTCPQAQRYPVRCRVTGSARIAGRLRPVKGTLTVVGLELHTRTYAYQLLYAPGS